jgi:hypothetical protein
MRIYFYTDDVDAFHHLLSAKGLSPGELHSTGYMREFDIYDPDGHCLTIGQQIREI